MKLTIEQINQFEDEERKSQDNMWGEQHHENSRWYLIAGEEFGEIGEAILSKMWCEERGERTNDINLVHEIVQLRAVLKAWLEFGEWDFGEEAESELKS